MLRTGLRNRGKQGAINAKANKKIAEMWEYEQINYCEIGLPGCMRTWPLQNVHRHRRNWYYNQPELLWDFNQVVRGCQVCHEQLDRRTEEAKQLTEEVFNRLRP